MLEHAEIARSGNFTTAAVPGLGVTVHATGDRAIFKRRAQKTNGTSECWLVGELDGVRCYVRSDGGMVNVVMTHDDLYPDL